jgi:hypothetical protein
VVEEERKKQHEAAGATEGDEREVYLTGWFTGRGSRRPNGADASVPSFPLIHPDVRLLALDSAAASRPRESSPLRSTYEHAWPFGSSALLGLYRRAVCSRGTGNSSLDVFSIFRD